MTKDELHVELDLAVPPGTKIRSHVRMIGHCLIDLELVTSIECAYESCLLESRTFEQKGPNEWRGRGILTIDHIVSLSDGGSDLPSNLQLMHFACNSAKGGRDAAKNRVIRGKKSAAGKRLWKDPAYRANMTGRVRSAETSAQASASMKTVWADTARSAAHVESLRIAYAARRAAATSFHFDPAQAERRSEAAKRGAATRARNRSLVT